MEWADWRLLAVGIALAVFGAYVLARPRRLFMFREDRAEYRPESVEYDSDHGRWLRKTAPLYLAAGVVMIGIAVL